MEKIEQWLGGGSGGGFSWPRNHPFVFSILDYKGDLPPLLRNKSS